MGFYIKEHMKTMKTDEKGSALIDVVLISALIAFVIMPLLSFVLDWFILINKVQTIRDAADLAALTIFCSLDNDSLGKSQLDFNNESLLESYKEVLSKNLHLDSELSPDSNSVLDGQAEIEELIIYSDDLPAQCPYGTEIEMKGIHVVLRITLKPSLYRGLLQELGGIKSTDIRLHFDNELPVNK
ncbi:MAG: hypothetical protein PHV32_10440 [Eubacteriales bacterium]|nr:hypothetical protein [Eubacteriales bacterium]